MDDGLRPSAVGRTTVMRTVDGERVLLRGSLKRFTRVEHEDGSLSYIGARMLEGVDQDQSWGDIRRCYKA